MSRWIMVSNRLPFKLRADGSFAPSSGGLVTAIGGIHTEEKVERIWMGGAPEGLKEQDWLNRRKDHQPSGKWSHVPVFVDENLYDQFYNGFCNDVLWPILHYQNDLVHFNDQAWNAYIKVNEIFAQKLASFARKDDLIWIHDYHFFLLPQFLRRLRPDLKIGFFLHVPFPSSEVFRQLPVRETILESLLAADLVGFHDYAYLHHFCSSLTRILGIDSSFLSVKNGNHTTRLGVFPVSIDTAEFKKNAAKPEVAQLENKFRKGQFLFLGVDRLDYIKGLDLKLCAFKSLLDRYPEVRGKVSLLQVAIPTRTGSPEFIKLYQETSRLIGEINGTYSRPDWTPIHYIYNSVNNNELMALYKSADALLVTSKRDGMNLVALEYIVTQSLERPGVVLLSEFTGALSTLSHTLRINPWNADDTADKMKLAMEMPKQEKVHRLQAMQKYLEGYTATDWARLYLQDLASTPTTPEGAELFVPNRDSVDELAHEINEKIGANGKLTLFLDYDGTLVPIEESPELAVLPSSTKQWLHDCSKRSYLNLIVVSGRDARFLAKQFDGLNIALAAEHGGSVFDRKKGKWIRRVHQPRSVWYPAAQKIMSHYSMRVPRSQVEKKRFAIAWHYRQSPQEYAGYMARKLADELETGLANLPVTIVRGKKVIEVRASEADKGVFANWFMESEVEHSFPIAFGDDRTDEDMFRAISGRGGISFRIGMTDTNADYMLEVQAQVLPFLSALFGRLDRLLGRAPSRRMELVPPAAVVHHPTL